MEKVEILKRYSPYGESRNSQKVFTKGERSEFSKPILFSPSLPTNIYSRMKQWLSADVDIFFLYQQRLGDFVENAALPKHAFHCFLLGQPMTSYFDSTLAIFPCPS